MVKKTLITTVLLVFFVLIAVSCSKGKTKQDWYGLALNAGSAGDTQTQKDAVLLYLLTYNESIVRNPNQNREDAVRLYTTFDFPDVLTTLVLKSDDILEGRIALYKAYAALGQMMTANDILETRIHGYLPTADYATLVINYPTDSEYTSSVLMQWLSTIKENDKDDFSELLQKFCRSDVEENTLKTILLMTEKLEGDSHFKNDSLKLSNVYKTKAIALEKLYDNYNSKRYWKMAYNLNKNDEEAREKK